MRPAHFPVEPLAAHALLDSGNGEKLERFGPVVLRRPEPQALWRPRLGASPWAAADLRFVRESDRGGVWEVRADGAKEARGPEPAWSVSAGPARLWIRPSPFKHVGLFPEQAANWRWLAPLGKRLLADGPPRLLNLFGYTGAASVWAAASGFHVTHVDASRLALEGLKDNAELSGIPKERLRWVLEDALQYAQREARRGASYQVVLLDPPHYGRGPKGQRWQLEEHLGALLDAVKGLLGAPGLLVLSTYAVGHSPLALWNLLEPLEHSHLEAGELVLCEEHRPGLPSRLLSQGFCARLWRGLDPIELGGENAGR